MLKMFLFASCFNLKDFKDFKNCIILITSNVTNDYNQHRVKMIVWWTDKLQAWRTVFKIGWKTFDRHYTLCESPEIYQVKTDLQFFDMWC